MNESSHPQPSQRDPHGSQPGLVSHVSPPPSYPPSPQAPPGRAVRHAPQLADPMPQRVKTARIALFLFAGFLIVLGLAALAQADAAQSSLGESDTSSDILLPSSLDSQQRAAAQMMLAQSAMGWGVVNATIALILAARFGKGANALRIGTIVYGVWHCVHGTFTLGLTGDIAPASVVMGALAEVGVGILLIILMIHKEGVAWFSRPRH